MMITPIKKFGASFLETKVVKKFHIPRECSVETMKTYCVSNKK